MSTNDIITQNTPLCQWHGDKDLNPEKRIWSPPFYRYNYRRMKWCAMRDSNPQAEAPEPKSGVYAVPPIAH